MPKDPTVQVAIIGVFATFITTMGVIIVAVINNRKERTGAAEEGIESSLRERIVLRDEQIAELRADLAEAREEIEKLKKGQRP